MDIWVASCVVNLIIVLIDEVFFSYLAQVLDLQVLDEDHLRIQHQLLVSVHLCAEIVARGREVEDEMEVLAHALQEAVVELVALDSVGSDDRAHVLKESQLIELFSCLLGIFLLLRSCCPCHSLSCLRLAATADQCALRLLLLGLNLNQG